MSGEKEEGKVDENELQQMLFTIEALREQISGLASQENLSRNIMNDYSLAKEGLEALLATEKGEATLIPIGGRVFVKATVPADQNVIVGIGRGVSVERTPKDGLEWVDEHLSEVRNSHSQIISRIREMETNLEDLTTHAQSMYMKLQAQGGATAEQGAP
ncbi:MAG: prefoldin subunit alpha [Thermoplasmata archaeon]|nr:prefoldin subunit alpha [Thermoplasmata archaeon]